MEKLTENMIRFAESKLGSTEYAGWCLAFIEDALEISNHIEIFGGDSAKESCELYKDALRGGVPERGAFVFYDCLCPSENDPVGWGHCGISFGDGIDRRSSEIPGLGSARTRTESKTERVISKNRICGGDFIEQCLI